MTILTLLRDRFAALGIDGFIVPSHDQFQSEYPPNDSRRLSWLTGFTGSAGSAVILQKKAAFFTDGRYVLQAQKEVSDDFERHNISTLSAKNWLINAAEKQPLPPLTIGYDPWLHTPAQIERLQHDGLDFVPVDNPIDALWTDRPAAETQPIFVHGLEYTGRSVEEKIHELTRAFAQHHVDIACITDPESVCWLLNIRGHDIPCTPVALCYALVHDTGAVDLFVDPQKITPSCQEHFSDQLQYHPLCELEDFMLRYRDKTIGLDRSTVPMQCLHHVQKHDINHRYIGNPCALPKSCKNTIEINGIMRAHQRDGLALTRFLYWLDHHPDITSVSELSAAERLLDFRQAHDELLYPSFDTISGFGANGAIVHYRVSEQSNLSFTEGSLYLVDSGGQYPDGTTDVTRTVAIGQPSDAMKDHFTRVLKGHIALATVQFPIGTTGSQLDSLARQFLWQVGLNYDHGTGHGVGHCLSVHEGPQRISSVGNNVALRPGMVISNEPGYYRTGEYGIRIENLVTVKPSMMEGFLRFETLTLAPIDTRLIDHDLLTQDERDWVRDYHRCILQLLGDDLRPEEREWVEGLI